MAVYDRWHTKPPKGATARCEHDLYPGRDHGRGDRWQVRWRDEQGRQRKRNFARKLGKNPEIHAEAFDKDVQARLLTGTYIAPDAGKETFRKFAEEVIENRTLDPSSRWKMRERMEKHIYPVLGDLELKTLARRPSLVQNLVRGLEKKKLAPEYIKVLMNHVSVVFACAVDDEKIVKNPCKASAVVLPKSTKKKIVPWTREQLIAMRAQLPRQHAVMVDIGAGTGLRQGEILGLSPDDVDHVERVLHVRRQIKVMPGGLVFAPPKGDKERTIPLEELLAIDLGEYVEEFPPGPVELPWREREGERRTVKLLFLAGPGRAIHRDPFNRDVWKPALVRAGIVPPPKAGEPLGDTRAHGMHALRHYFASALLTEGESVQAVAEWMGHHSPTVTLSTYAHLMPKSEVRMRQIIGRALRPVPEPSAQNVPSEQS